MVIQELDGLKEFDPKSTYATSKDPDLGFLARQV
jgi:hypothetical protein